MADAGGKAAEKLVKITECPICMSTFTDPRILPCIHTFCFNCLSRTTEESHIKPGDKMPCPLCRKEFIIPKVEGLVGLQRNFFMEDLIEASNMLLHNRKSTPCDVCKENNDVDLAKIREATVRCLECRDNFCDRCSQVHKVQKLSKNHKILKIGCETQEDIRRVISAKSCSKHIQKPLDYYCAECKKIVCVSCFVEGHKLHDCKDVATVDEEFRQRIEKNAGKISTYANEILSMRKNTEKSKADFLKEVSEREKEIHERNQELKNLIDEHTKSLLEELSLVKSNHLTGTANEMEETDRCWTLLRSFEDYCTEIRLKGSASDICSSVDELTARADELEIEYEAFIGRPHQSIEISFHITDIRERLQMSNRNIVGQIKVTSPLEVVAKSLSGSNSENSEENICSLENSSQLELKEQKLHPLPGFIELTTEPDIITFDDDPSTKRAKMPCGHVIGPDSMTTYFKHILKTGKYKFYCPSPNCNREWQYFLVRHVACLTEEEQRVFEKQLEHNFLEKAIGKQKCPGCKTWCERVPGTGICVCCPICTASKGNNFNFCWICLNEWKGFACYGACGNPGCDLKDKRIEILARCPTKKISNCNNCPTIRGCQKCGILIEHKDAYGHVICNNCGYSFCFICLKSKKDGTCKCKPFFHDCKIAPRQSSLPSN